MKLEESAGFGYGDGGRILSDLERGWLNRSVGDCQRGLRLPSLPAFGSV